MRFFTGLHQPSDARHFDAAFVSVNRLRPREAPMSARDWIMDSGAFTEISTHGHYRTSVAEYAAEVRRWATNGSGNLLAAVAQDWMCEPFIVARTGLSVDEHQRLTVERYDALRGEDCAGVYVLPVVQGFEPGDYVRHIAMYGHRLELGQWVGVGSVCKRSRARRAARAMGHSPVITYSLPSEGGASLRAAGFELDKVNAGGPSRLWRNRAGRDVAPIEDDLYGGKWRWVG